MVLPFESDVWGAFEAPGAAEVPPRERGRGATILASTARGSDVYRDLRLAMMRNATLV